MYLLKLATALILLALCQAQGETFWSSMQAEARLRRELRRRVDDVTRSMLPVGEASHTLTVYLGISLVRLYEMNEEKRTMTGLNWVKILWRDVHMTWDPTEYRGITSLPMDIHSIWKPDITLYSNLYPDLTRNKNYKVIVYYTGDVLWIPAAELTVPCSINGSDVTCAYKFGSWVYDGYQLNPEFYELKEGVDLADYINDVNWKLVNTTARKATKYYSCCSQPYPDLTFNVTFRHKDDDASDDGGDDVEDDVGDDVSDDVDDDVGGGD